MRNALNSSTIAFFQFRFLIAWVKHGSKEKVGERRTYLGLSLLMQPFAHICIAWDGVGDEEEVSLFGE